MYSPGLKFTITIKQNNGKYSLQDFAYKIGVISEQISTREAWKHLQQNYYCRFQSGLIWTYVFTCETKFRLGFQNLENSTLAAWRKNLEKQNKSEKSLPFLTIDIQKSGRNTTIFTTVKRNTNLKVGIESGRLVYGDLWRSSLQRYGHFPGINKVVFEKWTASTLIR